MVDRVLKHVAALLRMHKRSCFLLLRAGGEEFVISLTGSGVEAATIVCERRRLSVLQSNWALLHPDRWLTVSIGRVRAPKYDMKTLIECASSVKDRARQAGRNRVLIAAQKNMFLE
jgi:diguanylate cyclase (GGDEF)-like protein